MYIVQCFALQCRNFSFPFRNGIYFTLLRFGMIHVSGFELLQATLSYIELESIQNVHCAVFYIAVVLCKHFHSCLSVYSFALLQCYKLH